LNNVGHYSIHFWLNKNKKKEEKKKEEERITFESSSLLYVARISKGKGYMQTR